MGNLRLCLRTQRNPLVSGRADAERQLLRLLDVLSDVSTLTAGGVDVLRVLCLHGKGSSNMITEMQVHHIGLSKVAQCDFLHGPVQASPFAQEAIAFADEGGHFHAWHENSPTWGAIECALRRVLDHIDAHGPYDGLFGFSQGAGIATWLSRPGVLEALGRSPRDFRPWRFVICACGVDAVPPWRLREPSPELAALADRARDEQVPMPSLHIIGRWDWLRWWSSSLAGSYSETCGPKSVFYLDEGHELPMRLLQDRPLQESVVSFLEAFVNSNAPCAVAGQQ